MRNWKKVLRLWQCRVFWLTASECVFKNLHIASVIRYVRIYSTVLYFFCHDFCEKMFSLCLVIYRWLPTFCFVYNCYCFAKSYLWDFEDVGFHICWNHVESIISRRYSLSFRCFLLTASEPSWIAKQSIYFSEVELCSFLSFLKAEMPWALADETCWISGESSWGLWLVN